MRAVDWIALSFLRKEENMLGLIPTGSENAILAYELASLMKLSVRTVKEKIKSLRRKGILILSQSTGGYFFPSEGDKGREEAERYIKMMKRQIQERLDTIALTEDWLAGRKRVVVNHFTSHQEACLNFIPTGGECAILARDLASLMQLSVRVIKRRIKVLRAKGVLILSQSTGGYFLPSEGDKGREEAERYIKMMKRQIQERLDTIALTEDWLAGRRRVVVKQFTSS
jgi:biotin operon repressor